MSDVFLSFSSNNIIGAYALSTALFNRGIGTWMSTDSFKGTQDWAQVITGTIKECPLFIILFDRDYATSRHTIMELGLAVSAGRKLLPLRLDKSELPLMMAAYLNNVKWLDVPDGSILFAADEIAEYILFLLGKAT